MTSALSVFLAAFGLAGIGAFLLHVRQAIGVFPWFVSLACAGLGLIIAIAASSLSRLATVNAMRERSSGSIVAVCIVVAIIFAVVGSLFQMAVGVVVANSMQIDRYEYESIGIASTRLLTPSFFVVLHGTVCFGLAHAGLRRGSHFFSCGGLVVALPTLYLLIRYAKIPL